MVTQKTKDSIISKLKEKEVVVFTNESVTEALKNTVGARKLTNIAMEMIINKELT